MADRFDTDRTDRLDTASRDQAPQPGNRAERRAARSGRTSAQPQARGIGKVTATRVGHTRDPRQYAAHRRG